MNIEFAHLREMSTTGQYVDFAVFDAKPNSNTPAARNALLFQLTMAARQAGRKVDASALVYEENGEIMAWGDRFAVDYVSKVGVPAPTHSLSV